MPIKQGTNISEKEFEEWAERVGVRPSLERDGASLAWYARQPEIDALQNEVDLKRAALAGCGDMNKKLFNENTEAKAIINELRVLIQNSLTIDRNAPIWGMVKEFERNHSNEPTTPKFDKTFCSHCGAPNGTREM